MMSCKCVNHQEGKYLEGGCEYLNSVDTSFGEIMTACGE